MPGALPISAYVVLGLLDRHDGATPYQLDQRIRESIGYFWSFPRSQLYEEAGRLVRRGLVVERQEEGGRRRRTLSLTAEGRHELRQWLTTPTRATTEIHDEGLLRLYFQPLGPAEGDADGAPVEGGSAVVRLAAEQIEAHEARLAEYERLVASGRPLPGSPQRATLEVGLRFEQMIIGFWRQIAASPANPPGGALGA
ncbi:PadR family transcriptional regulator [Streptomyces sp. MI02-7b]|uniref:PadR family transcriptional regulator n=1 Tax=Streptomyces sp. MI02-7b TaxID=462941 RepID=UPI0029AFCE9C|nr:PadR family transcriptional regulator [Streptomyces sp. MI02-7b]MDX3075463.1 PadR family transcriptional regulator [Streptomyces sp. MI02-7b]